MEKIKRKKDFVENSKDKEYLNDTIKIYHIVEKQNKTENEIECCNLPAFKVDIYGNTYCCIHCDVIFYDDRSVKNHLGAVHKDFHYFCKYCGQYFPSDWQLKRHQILYAYNCEHCEYSTNHYSQFRRHSSRIHKINMKPKFQSENRFNQIYECEICGYQVLRPHMFSKHMTVVHGNN